MNATERIILNTSAQYVRTIIGGILTLYSARIILCSLGTDDFGIYSLVAGVVMMLSFITNALSSTTQRYVSYYQGKSDKEQVKIVFSNSIFLHLGIGVFLIVLLGLLYPFLFHIITIPGSREMAATYVYFSVIATLFLSFMTSPFRAILISHENIVYISIIDLLDIILKLLIALSLSYISYDKLIYYGIMLVTVQLFNIVAFGIYCFWKYEECIPPQFSHFNKEYINGLSSFAGWSIYTIGCQVGRTQGLNIVINRLIGTAANAAYGLALQVSAYANFLSDALLNSMKPQIIKAEGGGDRNKMLFLSELACKYSFFMMSLVAIPCLFETPKLLELWLGDVPPYTVLFTRMYILAMILDMLTYSLNITNQAIGKLKVFTICVNTGKLLTVPLSFVLLKIGFPIFSILVCYVAIELLSAGIRLPIIKIQTGLSYGSYVRNVIFKIALPLFFSLLVCILITNVLETEHRLIYTFIASTIVYIVCFYVFAMNRDERERIQATVFKHHGKK